MRDLGPHVHEGMAAVFLNCNRGKQSVVLDLTTDDGRRDLRRLTDTADVVVHNMRAAAAERCGADPDTLRATNPRLIHCSIRGFGSGGRYRDLPAYDDIIQAASGVAAQQEWTAGHPAYVVSAVGDKVSGLTTALAITAAAHGRGATGDGTTIEVPMTESLAAFGLVEHLWGRTFVPPRGGAVPRMSSCCAGPRTADGHISVVVYTRQNWERFFEMIGRPELNDDPRFHTLSGRTEHLDELYTLIGEHLSARRPPSGSKRLTAAGIPAVPYNRVDDLFDDPHLDDVGFWEEVEHPTEGTLLQVPTPFTYDGGSPRLGLGAQLGADTSAVLGAPRPPVAPACRRPATGRSGMVVGDHRTRRR